MKAYNHTILNIALERGTISADIKQGELVHVDAAGKATNVVGSGNLAFVAEKEVIATSIDHVTVRAVGVAAVFVADYTNIVPGSELTIGDDGKGVKVRGTGELKLGIALKKPSQNGEQIPMLIDIEGKASNLY